MRVAAYAPLALGEDPPATEVVWARLCEAFRDQGQRGLAVTAPSGIEVALWDLKGKRLGVPVSTLLGGRLREEVRARVTGSFRTPGGDRVRDRAAEAAGHAALMTNPEELYGFSPFIDRRHP